MNIKHPNIIIAILNNRGGVLDMDGLTTLYHSSQESMGDLIKLDRVITQLLNTMPEHVVIKVLSKHQS